MKHWLLYYFAVAILTAIGFILFKPVDKSNASKVVTTSPLPKFLTMSENSQVTSLELWSPTQENISDTASNLPITANSVLSYDVTTDEVLLAKNADTHLPMASLTKVMTAIIALEHPKSDNHYVVRSDALVGEDSMGLEAGEILSLDELLYGLILHSANDAGMVLADNYQGGVNSFTEAMNDKARTLGLTDTHFTNPTGLEGDGSQYTTSHDLLVITRYALVNFPLFDKIAATFDYVIPQTPTHKEYDLENETNLLTSYPGVKGVKTGYTDEAGLCLITYLDYEGHQIIAVLLGSENRRQDMKDILDYSLKKLDIIPPQHD